MTPIDDQKWEPSNKLKAIVYVINNVGALTLVVGFLLGQSAGWVPSMAQMDHTLITKDMSFIKNEVKSATSKAERTELAALRTQNIALQICVELFKKENQYKCLKPYLPEDDQ